MRTLIPRPVLAAGILLALGFLVGRACTPASLHSGDSAETAESRAKGARTDNENTRWTCSMHPQVQLPEPGKCPICFMDLIPTAGSRAAGDPGRPVLTMSRNAVALAGISTARVERRSVAREIDMVGKIALDETRLAYITSWVPGRLNRLFVDYTGVTVRKDDHLVEIYSPTLYSAQQELLQAIRTARRLKGSSLDILRDTGKRTVVSSTKKLRLYGLTDAQIRSIVQRGVPNENITIQAPIGGVVVHKNALEGMYVDEGSRIYTIADLSKVWVLLDAYESDIAWMRYGQDVEFSVEAYPGETFHGRVAFIDPLLNDRTRTVKIRLNVENTDRRLKPDMFVSATAQAVLTAHGKVVDEDLAGKWMCPMHPEITADTTGTCSECGMDLVPSSELGFVSEPAGGDSLVIPATAPLVTGKRAIVYVRVPDSEQPTFEGREIALGPRAGDWYVVQEGLREGEEVVTSGNFKIDSELQIRALPSMMSPVHPADPAPAAHGDHARGGHEHRDLAHPPVDAAPGNAPSPQWPAPTKFRQQIGAIVDAYVALTTKLASDEEAPEQTRELTEAIQQVDGTLLNELAREEWTKQSAALQHAATTAVEAKSLATRRTMLSPLSDRLTQTLKTFGYEFEERPVESVSVFHCPMALQGEGANWLQIGETTANPYYGSSMLRCGSQSEVLPKEN